MSTIPAKTMTAAKNKEAQPKKPSATKAKPGTGEALRAKLAMRRLTKVTKK